jgi:addiction module RelB/DinJ family antitoxin
MKDSVVRARIGAKLKAQASEVLAACGLEASDAIRLFFQQVVLHGGIPFSIRSQGRVRVVSPNRLRKMKHAAQVRDHAIAAKEDISGGEMLLIRPNEARGAEIKWPSEKPSA